MMHEKVQAEVNVLLASVDNDYERRTINDECAPILMFAKAMDASILTDIQREGVINLLFKFVHTGLLSPLTLKDDEFHDKPYKGINKRYSPIYKALDGNIYNSHAFMATIRAEYDHTKQNQVYIEKYDIFIDRLYLSKGGVITGEYISECKIKDEIVNEERFVINDIIKIPAAIILDDDYVIYAVDHREPTLKELSKTYDVSIHVDKDIKGKYNIRNYKKLEK